MNKFKKLYNWYKSHNSIQWMVILVPLWIQPFHMWAMGEQVAHNHGLVNLEELPFRLSHWSFWTDIFWLSVDYLEFVAIFSGTEKFIRYLKTRNKKSEAKPAEI
ncbi:MAG TPA: hypothetical protein VFG25_03230 [Nitrosopumilaceae archaeon]|nr:hypothetical protein [Nitrosopumilaceae archaeon]